MWFLSAYSGWLGCTPWALSQDSRKLLAAAKGEKEEWDVLYREFAKVAEEEGFIEIEDPTAYADLVCSLF